MFVKFSMAFQCPLRGNFDCSAHRPVVGRYRTVPVARYRPQGVEQARVASYDISHVQESTRAAGECCSPPAMPAASARSKWQFFGL